MHNAIDRIDFERCFVASQEKTDEPKKARKEENGANSDGEELEEEEEEGVEEEDTGEDEIPEGDEDEIEGEGKDLIFFFKCFWCCSLGVIV